VTLQYFTRAMPYLTVSTEGLSEEMEAIGAVDQRVNFVLTRHMTGEYLVFRKRSCVDFICVLQHQI
jgi:hypothetical protein